MKVSILIPTYNRATALAATLTSLLSQGFRDFEVVVADQSDESISASCTIQSLCRILDLHGNPVRLLTNFPRRGIAQQRQFLLDRSAGDYSLFLDDDVILEPDALERMVEALEEEQCGFTGMALIGLTYLDDHRPDEQHIELWRRRVEPEVVRPGSMAWNRHLLHNAANIFHVAQKLPGPHRYKVAWIGGCVLYDTQKLREMGGFGFWKELPEEHCGEDVLAQLRLLEKFGGCALLPSGAYHQELPTTIKDRGVDAPAFFIERTS